MHIDRMTVWLGLIKIRKGGWAIFYFNITSDSRCDVATIQMSLQYPSQKLSWADGRLSPVLNGYANRGIFAAR